VNPSYINGLTCGGTTGNWWQMPRQHTTATIIDVHSAPCVGISNGNRECDPNQVGSTTNEAITAFNAIAAFLASFAPPNGWRYVCCGYDANMANALVMLGETHGHTLPRSSRDPNTWCPSSDYSMRWDPLFTDYTVTGFNSSNLHGRTLPNGLPGWVAFRPWEYLEYTGPSAALCNPVYVNPPYKASN
jgi:hypothetical protein